jgi:uncharacterized damage-inducible protein DinB
MGRAGIEQTLYLMHHAFEGDGQQEHALLTNLSSVTADDWLWAPPGAVRSIRQIVSHVAACKQMYRNHAFEDGGLSWGDTARDLEHSMTDLQDRATLENEPARERILDWLVEGHQRLVAAVETLRDDAELLALRRASWGAVYETRWLIGVTIQHDLYHAGEINHVRALKQGNDAWPWAGGEA